MRGTVAEQAWGVTLGGLGARKFSGQLLLQAEGRQYGLAFDRGEVIGATSPAPADAVARIALTNRLVTSTQVPELMRRLTAAPERADVDILAEIVKLSPDQVHELRGKVVAQRAARTFSVDDGEYLLQDQIAMPVTPGTRIPIGAIIHLGVRMNLSEQRLAADLRSLGSQYRLVPGAVDDLTSYAIDLRHGAILDALRDGTSLPELEAVHRDVDPRTLQAIIYTLVACGVCDATGSGRMPAPPRAPTGDAREWATASGTPTPQGSGPAIGRAPTGQREWNIAVGTPSRPDISRAPTQARPPLDEPDLARAPTRPRSPDDTQPAPSRTMTPRPTPATVSRAFTKPGSGMPERPIVPAPAPRTPTRTAPATFRPPAQTARPPEPRPAPSETRIPASQLRPPASDSRTPLSGVSEARNPFATQSPVRTITPTATEERAVARTTLPPPATTPVVSRTATPAPSAPRTTSPPPVSARPTTPTSAPRTTAPTAAPRTSTPTDPPRTMTTTSPPRTVTPTVPPRRTPTPTAVSRTATPLPRDRTDSQAAISVKHPTTPPSIGARTGPEAAVSDPSLPRTPSAEWGETKLDTTPNSASMAVEAFARGERAMKRDDMVEAVNALREACELNPKQIDYQATYAWAKFCAAPSKEMVAADVRKALERAMYKSDNPEIARFFLGRVERMMGRDREALKHFQQVLNYEPNHREARSEIRVIEARLSSKK